MFGDQGSGEREDADTIRRALERYREELMARATEAVLPWDEWPPLVALDVLLVSLARSESALRPFARDSEAFDRSEGTYGDGPVFERLSGPYHWRFTIADVRAARAALASQTEEANE